MIARTIVACVLFISGIAIGPLLFGELSVKESRAPVATQLSAVTRQEVWEAVATELRGRGLADQQLPQVDDIDLPLALPALAGRKLRVLSACWDESARRTQFRLECGELGQCLPFLVYLGSSVRDEGNSAERAVSCRLGASHAPAQTVLRPVVRAGDRAMAVFVAGRLRMTTSVICLERGHKGGIIRVRSQDGHIFRARISGPALLEALPQ
jgi:hypothetical protein